MSPRPTTHDHRKQGSIVLGALAGFALGFVGTAVYCKFDGQSAPAAVIIGLAGAPTGALLGWLAFLAVNRGRRVGK